jgi:hypothetical protein
MEESIIQRVNDFMDSLPMKLKAFSMSIGIPESTLKQQLNGKIGKGRGVQTAVITAILSNYPKLSAEWLLRGEGTMERTDESFVSLNKELARLKDENSRLLSIIEALSGAKTAQEKKTA